MLLNASRHRPDRPRSVLGRRGSRSRPPPGGQPRSTTSPSGTPTTGAPGDAGGRTGERRSERSRRGVRRRTRLATPWAIEMRRAIPQASSAGASAQENDRRCAGRIGVAARLHSRRPGAAATARSPATRVDGTVSSSDATSWLAELVSDAVDRQQVPRPARIRLELAADVLDVRVDRAFEGLHLVAADGIEQLRPREDAAGLSASVVSSWNSVVVRSIERRRG